ncbi:MAG: c-type cytochrome [Planctomycetes bacterium]|nr:c-type cytochrome [Planctomycetota bacterium]
MRWLLFTTVLAASSAAPGVRAAGLPPAEALKTIRVAPGFRVELVAHEPLVQDPVAIAWDARGRLWVAEMADYPSEPGGGRVRVLEDLDRDGRPERSELVAEGLPFVASVLPFRDGVLAAAAPSIWMLEASGRRAVLTGFGEGNTQLRVNGLTWGMDGRIYGANGRSGGRIRRPSDPESLAVDIGNRDFRFDPGSFRPEAEAGPSQFGHAFDAWGRRFLSWNTIHVRLAMLAPRDLERHPRLKRTATLAHISDHGDDARIFPIAPPPRTFNDEPTDRFNASCGLTVEGGGVFPPSHAGNVFVCEPLTGLVHRDVLVPGPGPALVARRGEEDRDFLASTDPWFHPVFARSGPDGALYIADLYREMVEHPDFVRAELRRGIDFRVGAGHGRIWRVVPEGAALLPVEDLGFRGFKDLVGSLASANARVRETAQRILLERHEERAVDALAVLAFNGEPVARAWALWTLERLDRLGSGVLEAALEADEPRLREVALRVWRDQVPRDEACAARVLELTRDADPAVRLQAVLAAGDLRGAEAGGALARAVLESGGDPWTTAAALSGLAGREAAFLDALASGAGAEPAHWVADAAAEAADLVALADGEAALRVLGLADGQLAAGRTAMALALGAGLASGGRDATAWAGLVRAAKEVASRAGAPARERARAASLLGHAAWRDAQALGPLLDPKVDLELGKVAARALGHHGAREATGALLEAWPAATPALRGAILDALLARPGRLAALAAAIEAGAVNAREVDLARREPLLRAAGDDRPRLERLLKGESPGRDGAGRAAVVARYRDDLSKGDAIRGAAVFAARCAPCHRLGGVGHAVGPELGGAAKKGRDELLAAILDPSQTAVPGYAAYAAVLEDGRVLAGVLASETAQAVTLRGPGGTEETIARSALRALESTAASLMPEGLEAEIDPQAMADLLEHLRQAGR